jgi:hypothetical protein
VDPTRLELVTSAMRGRHEGLQEFSRACKKPANGTILIIVLFLDISGYSLGLLHGCCTEDTACIRIRSGMIVIRPAPWRPLRRASSLVYAPKLNFAFTAF